MDEVVAVCVFDLEGEPIFYHPEHLFDKEDYDDSIFLNQRALNEYVESNDEGVACRMCGRYI